MVKTVLTKIDVLDFTGAVQKGRGTAGFGGDISLFEGVAAERPESDDGNVFASILQDGMRGFGTDYAGKNNNQMDIAHVSAVPPARAADNSVSKQDKLVEPIVQNPKVLISDNARPVTRVIGKTGTPSVDPIFSRPFPADSQTGSADNRNAEEGALTEGIPLHPRPVLIDSLTAVPDKSVDDESGSVSSEQISEKIINKRINEGEVSSPENQGNHDYYNFSHINAEIDARFMNAALANSGQEGTKEALQAINGSDLPDGKFHTTDTGARGFGEQQRLDGTQGIMRDDRVFSSVGVVSEPPSDKGSASSSVSSTGKDGGEALPTVVDSNLSSGKLSTTVDREVSTEKVPDSKAASTNAIKKANSEDLNERPVKGDAALKRNGRTDVPDKVDVLPKNAGTGSTESSFGAKEVVEGNSNAYTMERQDVDVDINRSTRVVHSSSTNNASDFAKDAFGNSGDDVETLLDTARGGASSERSGSVRPDEKIPRSVGDSIPLGDFTRDGNVRQSDGRASLALDKGVSAVYSGFAGNKGSADVSFTQPVRTAFYAESNETAAGDGRSVAGSFNADTVRTMNDAVIKEVRDNPVIRHALFMDKGIFAPKVGFNSSGRGTSDATTDAGEADVIPMESGNKKVLDYDALVKKFSGSQADDSRYKGRPEGLEQSIQKETEKTVPGSVLRDRAVHQVTSDDEGKQKAANVNSPADFKIASIKEKNAASLASKQVSYTDKGILAPQRDLAEGREGLSDGVDNASQSDEVSNPGVPGQTENSSAPDGVVRDVSGSGRKFGEANVNVRQGGAAGSQRQVSDGELYADLTVENDSAKARVDISRQEDRIYSGVKIPVFGDGRNNQATSVAGTAYVAAAGVRGAVQQTNLQQEKNFTANDLLTDGNNGLFEAGDAHVDLQKRVVSAEGANIMVKIQRGGSGFSVDEHAGKSSTNGIAEISSQNPGGQASRMNDSPSVDDGNVVEQVLSQLPENAFKGATRVRINLQPESLGKVDMDIVVRENSVRIFIVADRSEVVQALQGQQEQLKNALQSQGLQIGNLDFHLRDNPNLMDDGSRGGEMLRQQQQGGRQRESRHYVEPVIPETSGRLAAIRNMQSAERTVSIFV